MGGVDIDRKLGLTAAALGARTRKDLAAAFRRANPRTSFDIERANKWLQGRARPRDQQIYDDWSLVLGIGRSGAWIADCDLDSFLDALSEGRGEDRTLLQRRARAFSGEPDRPPADAGATSFQGELAGTYVCYSTAWSSYFAGRLIRGAMRFEHRPGGFAASYTQSRVQDSIVARGDVDVLQRAVLMHLREPHGRTGFLFSLFPPMSLISVLGGLMCGSAVLGVDPQPSVSRILMVRLREDATDRLLARDCLLAPGASVAADLADLGAAVADPAEADRRVSAFLHDQSDGSLGPPALGAFRSLVEFFDRDWILRGFPSA